MRTRIAAAFTLAVLLPLAAFAQTTQNSQLSSLTAELSQLEQQIAALSASSATTASTPTPSNTPATQSSYTGICPDLQENLSVGSTGIDVDNLQGFLAGQGLFAAAVTGYYGSVTEASVEAFQESRGIVSSGSPSTTGFGAVGPKTRETILTMCPGSAGVTSCIPTAQPTSDCPTGWQPVTDAKGCTEYYQCSIQLPTNEAQSSGSVTVPTNSSTPQACPTVQQPSCLGTVVPFQTNASGCVTSYECVIN